MVSQPALKAQWAQPSGIYFSQDSMELYVCDAESSSIRAIQFTTEKPCEEPDKDQPVISSKIAELIGPLCAAKTRTLVGANENIPEDLELYGDKDGNGSKARLQHPLGCQLRMHWLT